VKQQAPLRTRVLARSLILLILLLAATATTATTIDACHRLDDVGDESADPCYRQLLNTSADSLLQAEALWRLGNIEAANRAFQTAAQTHPEDPDVLALWGLLYLDAHQAADAEALFNEALAINPSHLDALLGQAVLYADRFEGRAEETIARILAIDPGNPEALVLDARLKIEAARLSSARSALEELLETTDEPRPRLQAMALLAAADHMDGTAVPGQSESPWTSRALDLNPHYGDVYAIPAYFFVITRRYREAVAMLEMAVAIDPNHWRAHTDLGTNLLRVNRLADATTHLQTAYSGDPFNAQTINTLRLLDSLESYHTTASDNLILRTHPEESAVLTPYVRELVDRAEIEMAGRYNYTLQSPVVLELYQRHDDFAVRTSGLPGIGILGATFGDVIVMDGPSAKSASTFDWYSAVWHELAHVVTLNATDNLVSRWFSEGVSVYEEQRYGPSQNASVSLDFLQALKDDLLLPTAILDQGFMRPSYENQIGVSYTQAGLLCTYIADTYDGGLTRILQAYRTGAHTVDAIEQGLGFPTSELDEGFFAHLENEFGAAAHALREVYDARKATALALKEKRWADAQTAAGYAIELYPAYVGPGSSYLDYARAIEQQTAEAAGAEDAEAAPKALLEYFHRGGRDPGAMAHLADLLYDNGQPKDAIDVQSALVRLDPLKAEHHALLGNWLAETDRQDQALTEFQAVLALEPHDRATAHYQVASTLHQLNRTEEARRELLYALEIAPRFSPALSLLVEINQ
jgi:tetratricopeptide (TPR) repeat protein